MLSVCITRWSTVMSLFLVMSTLPPFLLLLPTVESSVAHNIVRQMLPQQSVDSYFSLISSRTFATGLLGKSLSAEPPAAQKCEASLNANPIASKIYVDCIAFSLLWLNQLNASGIPYMDPKGLECRCKQSGCNRYCSNLIARTYCTADQYASFRQFLQQIAAEEAQVCKPWPEWTPSLDSPPLVTSEATQCQFSLDVKEAKEKKCKKEVTEKTVGITDPKEILCKAVVVASQCLTKMACKDCESAGKYVDFENHMWTPIKAECKKFSEVPEYNCPVNILLIVGIILAVIVILVVIGVVVYCMCFASDGSRGGSSSNPSSHHSRPPGSSAGAKQSSYA